MKKIVINLVVVLAVGAFVSGVWACPGEAVCSCPKAQNVAQSDKPSCGGDATTVADAKSSGCGSCPKSCGGSVAKAGGDSCGKSCGSSCSKTCDKSCGQKSVTLTSGEADKQGCSATKSCGSSCGKDCGSSCGKTCDKPCGHNTATLTSGKGYHGGCSEGKAADEPTIEAVMASFPSMKYRVGDHVTSCSKSAEADAKQTGQPIHYLVGDSTFDNPGQAKMKLAALLNHEVDELKTVQYVAGGHTYHCPKTANKVAGENGGKVAYRVAGFDFDCQDKAESAAKLVSERLAEVKMSYKVGDQSFCCDKTAGMTAKKTGAPLHYVVEGEETPCEKTAELMLAEAMVRAAVLTAAAAFAS